MKISSFLEQEQIVISCVKNDIALYSPHTSFDSVADGVNYWLVEPYGKMPSFPSNDLSFCGCGRALAAFAKSLEVVGSNPVRCGAFFFFFSFSPHNKSTVS